MVEHRRVPRTRTLRSGKIVFNHDRSVVDCTVRNLSTHGACLELASLVGVPDTFVLTMSGDAARRACRLVWKTDHRAGVAFDEPVPERRDAGPPDRHGAAAPQDGARSDAVRAELRAGLDAVAFGVVLLDQNLRAQFINRAFRRLFRLPDAKADAKPSFTALMVHGRETGVYELPADGLDATIAERVEHVKAGNPAPLDLRLAGGEAFRFQCAALPAGGRMLSYTPVTDIMRQADEVDVLRAALDAAGQGIILLDADLNATFVNHAARTLWRLPDKAGFGYADILQHGYEEGLYDVPADTLDTYVAGRIAHARAGDPQPVDLLTNDGRVIRSQCTALPGGRRMIRYVDVTGLLAAERAPHIQAAE